jgi:hypothetical protein
MLLCVLDNVNAFGTILIVRIPFFLSHGYMILRITCTVIKQMKKKITFHALYTKFTLLTQFYTVKCDMPNIALNQLNW